MKKIIKILFGFCILFSQRFIFAAPVTEEIETRVVPVVTTSLISAPTYYNFGNLEVATSSNSATALELTNDGTVGVKVEKTIWDDDGWDITKSTDEIDGFNLWSIAKSTELARPNISDFETSKTHNFSKDGVGSAYYNNLTDDTGAQIDLDPDEKANLWLRIDLPAKVTTGSQQRIKVKLKAISNSN